MNPWIILLANLFPIVCVICGTILAIREKEGWGWLFVMAALSVVSINTIGRLAS